jgi:cytochrome c2
MPTCSSCTSKSTVKNGHIHNGKQRFKCCNCGRQFVEDLQNKVIPQATDAVGEVGQSLIPRYGQLQQNQAFRALNSLRQQYRYPG